MSYIGTSKIGGMYLGATKIGKAYLGSDLVYSSVQEILPYDAQVEYLYSDGNAYIDTGINADGGLSIECEFRQGATTNAAIAGAIYNRGSVQYYRHHLSPYSNAMYWYNSDKINGSSGISDTTNYHHIIVDATNGTTTLDNTTTSFTVAVFDCQCNYHLFSRNSLNMNAQSKASYFKYFKMSRNGVLVRDFIPVRVGSVGYMYDKVSKQLFGNVGTGNFTFGNDKTT